MDDSGCVCCRLEGNKNNMMTSLFKTKRHVGDLQGFFGGIFGWFHLGQRSDPVDPGKKHRDPLWYRIVDIHILIA